MRVRVTHAILVALLVALSSCSPPTLSQAREQGSSSQGSETILTCDYKVDVGVSYREIYVIDIAARSARLASSVPNPGLAARAGSATVNDNTYGIEFPELNISGAPIEGSALRIQINRYSGESDRLQVDRSGNGSISHRGHCVRFDPKDKL